MKTDNPFDVAIQGDGWMAIRTQGGIAYTRDGRMRMSESGALETLIGNPVLDAGGAPIVLNPTGGKPTIGGDGMISQDGRQVGAIGLFSIDPQANLSAPRIPASSPIGRRRRSSISPRTASPRATWKGANINPIQEMTKLISLTRNFDGVNSEVTQTETSMEDAIKTLGARTAAMRANSDDEGRGR